MKKLSILLLVLSITLVTQAASKAKLNEFLNATDAFMKSTVTTGSVKYATIKKSPAALNALIAQIGAMNLHGFTADEKKAFYINAYNVSVIKGIVNNYPLEKPLDVDGFFDKIKYTVAGESLTLNEIENSKVRIYNDARIHFALVCAARGCPSIVDYAYRPEKLEAQLQERTISSLNDPNFIRVKPNAKTVYISEIFKWYEGDFLKEGKTVVAFINKFRRENSALPSSYKVANYPYNWKLNEYK